MEVNDFNQENLERISKNTPTDEVAQKKHADEKPSNTGGSNQRKLNIIKGRKLLLFSIFFIGSIILLAGLVKVLNNPNIYQAVFSIIGIEKKEDNLSPLESELNLPTNSPLESESSEKRNSYSSFEGLLNDNTSTSPKSEPEYTNSQGKVTNTPIKKLADYKFDTNRKIIRTYLSDKGDPVISQSKMDSNPRYEPVSRFRHEKIEGCFSLKETSLGSTAPVDILLKYYKNERLIKDLPLNEEICESLPIYTAEFRISMEINPEKTPIESDYTNNTIEFTYEMKEDATPPEFEMSKAFLDSEGKTCVGVGSIWDNIDNINIHVIHYLDGKLVSSSGYEKVCVGGTAGDPHTFKAKAVDSGGNVTEKSKDFEVIADCPYD